MSINDPPSERGFRRKAMIYALVITDARGLPFSYTRTVFPTDIGSKFNLLVFPSYPAIPSVKLYSTKNEAFRY